MEARILWADDEIDLLKPHILFLREKGFDVDTVNNGEDAVEMAEENQYDIIFLDENMPGLNGLETLAKIKKHRQHTPVVMITKSEEEHLMEEAIGGQISDYLIKPVHPKQILLSLKKHLESKTLVSQKAAHDYQMEFRAIGSQLNGRLDANEWTEVYKKLVHWELKLAGVKDDGMREIIAMQKKEANIQFCKFVERHYAAWLKGDHDPPLLSHQLLSEKLIANVEEAPSFLIVIDNLRYDQWCVLRPFVSEYFDVAEEALFYAILPTTTQYARNALFAGSMPLEIKRQHPDLWSSENDEGGKNNHERELLERQLKRHGKNIRLGYHKVVKLDHAKKMVDRFNELLQNDLTVIVYNFVDMLSHARTEMEVIKELADDEKAYRSLTVSWFNHSPLKELLRKIAEKKTRVFLTTDHGTIRVAHPVKVMGDRSTNSNLRYKVGKALRYSAKEAFACTHPETLMLPQEHVSAHYIFSRENDFFVYPTNYHHYANYYKDTFQHGGVSMEEMMIPWAALHAK